MEPKLRTTTGLMLDLHYECNMPAADANEKAHILLETDNAPRNLCVIGNGYVGSPIQTVYSPLRSLPKLQHEYGTGLEYGLIADGESMDSPRLVAVFCDDLALPIANFERREDDRCSYVQIGQEMHDENFVLLSTDHSRLDYVEAIRELIEKRGRLDTNPSLLLELTQHEMSMRGTEITAELPARLRRAEVKLSANLCRLVSETVQNPAWDEWADHEECPLQLIKKPLLVQGGEAAPKTMLLTIFPDWKLTLTDGRPIQLALASNPPARRRFAFRKRTSEQNQPNDISLIALDEQDVALTLLTFSDRTGSVVGPETEIVGMNIQTRLQEIIQDTVAVNLLTVSEASQLEALEKALSNATHRQMPGYVRAQFRSRRIAERKKVKPTLDRRQELADFVDELGLKQAFDAQVGEYDPALSSLLTKVGQLAAAGAVHYGLLENEPIPKSSTDIHVSAEVTKQGAAYRLRLLLQPVGLVGKKDSLVRFDDELHLAQPNKLDADEAEELLHLLGALSMVGDGKTRV